MTTMLSDQAERVGDATTLGGTPPDELRADLRRWKDEVLAAIRAERPLAYGVDEYGATEGRVPSAAMSYATAMDAGSGGTIGHTKQAVAEVGQAVKADALSAKLRTEAYVAGQPIKALGIAAAVGFAIGVCWNRRS
jgi:ElaB/YqjD/DUF883 family membrane-anchored ribosome-binding protein